MTKQLIWTVCFFCLLGRSSSTASGLPIPDSRVEALVNEVLNDPKKKFLKSPFPKKKISVFVDQYLSDKNKINSPPDSSLLLKSTLALFSYIRSHRGLEQCSSGTGVLVRKASQTQPSKSVVMTAAHLVKIPKRSDRIFVFGVTARGEIIRFEDCLIYDTESDIAILQVDRFVKDGLSIARKPPNPLDKTMMCGSIADLYFLLRRSEVMKVLMEPTKSVIYLSGHAGSGSSGSPIMNQQGQLVGIVSRIQPFFRQTGMIKGDHFSEAVVLIGAGLLGEDIP